MNVGIQDAANLAWKIAATLNRWAPAGLLDTYHAERHPVGADLTATSRAQVALMTAFTPEGLDLRGLLARLITALPDLNDHLATQVSSLAVTYPPTTPGGHPLTGTRAPDLNLGDTGLFALLRVDRHLLLDLTGSGRLTRYAHRRLHVHTATPYQPPAEFTDVRAVLIRPDGHIAWTSAEHDGTALTDSLTAALATTHHE